MPITLFTFRHLKKAALYIAYWTVYLVIFSLIEGLPAHDLFNAFAGELASMPVKIIFVTIVVEKLAVPLFQDQRFIRFCGLYSLLLVACAFLLRLVDNAIILKYLLTRWHPEPLLSAAPFLYNAIKLQFLVTIPFCFRLYNYRSAEKLNSGQLQDFIQVKCDRRMLKIPLTNVCYVEAQGNYLHIHTLSGVHKTHLTFSELEAQLPGASFVRVHRSFMVSLAQVKSFTSAYLNIGDQQIPIGRSYQSKAKSALTKVAGQ